MGFYKSFGRPVAKVFLGAVFTYQLAYWIWVKLETDEVKKKKKSRFLIRHARAQILVKLMVRLKGQILELETEVRRLSS